MELAQVDALVGEAFVTLYVARIDRPDAEVWSGEVWAGEIVEDLPANRVPWMPSPARIVVRWVRYFASREAAQAFRWTMLADFPRAYRYVVRLERAPATLPEGTPSHPVSGFGWWVSIRGAFTWIPLRDRMEAERAYERAASIQAGGPCYFTSSPQHDGLLYSSPFLRRCGKLQGAAIRPAGSSR